MRNNKMAKNHMKEVARMLGVELKEEFYIKGVIDSKYKITNDGVFFRSKKDGSWLITSWTLNKVLAGELEIIKIPKPILDEAEKEYLSNVIKPFRDTVKRIVKGYNFGREFISIDLEHGEIQLPYFEPDTMYKGMEIYKDYTLEELGL